MSVVLTGRVDTWQQYITAGNAAVGKGYKGVVNDITVAGVETVDMSMPSNSDFALQGREFDIVIIGGGVIGAAVARELTRWDVSIALLEKEDDLAKHTSSRNSGIVHPGLDPSPGSKKAWYNVKGNKMFAQVALELGIELNQLGLLVLFTSNWEKLVMPLIHRRARQNGVPGLKYLSRKTIAAMEPNVTSRQRGGVWLPTAGIISPYKLTIAYAENAVENGAAVFFNTVVTGFEMDGRRILNVQTNRGKIRTHLVINAAGVWADKVAGYANDRFFSIHPRRGVLAVLDKKVFGLQRYQVGMFRSKWSGGVKSKGGGITPTTDGNLLIGPTAIEKPGREDYSTSMAELQHLFDFHLRLNRKLKPEDVINYFAGTRACTFEEDFIIEPSEYVTNLMHVAGIQSPGLAASPAIASDVAKKAVKLLSRELMVRPNPRFNPRRQRSPELNKLPLAERAQLIKENPRYGRMICRCEGISEGEIVAAIHSSLPTYTLDGIKRRRRAGMGRCQGGFCTPRLLDIITREAKIPITDVEKKGEGSELVLGLTKGAVDYHNKKLRIWQENNKC
jgi:glycerol-3-phosphate dehydrogenase